jgi:hypothetical protein
MTSWLALSILTSNVAFPPKGASLPAVATSSAEGTDPPLSIPSRVVRVDPFEQPTRL